jgi:hypothetical protein
MGRISPGGSALRAASASMSPLRATQWIRRGRSAGKSAGRARTSAAGRRNGIGIDRDQFEVEVVAQPEQAVMGAHARVLAALGELDAQQRFQPGGTGIQVARGEGPGDRV